ncbi:MAG TPA: AraC family transcriptional regulator [Cytophagales bacterium]|nr:AraC family transcriptional regulator [Cytophagales bacterium]
MKAIPIRKIKVPQSQPESSESFNIRNIQDVLDGKDMVHDLHRHEYYFVLVLQKGNGIHTIDFNPYKVNDHSIFFIRPGQVHELTLQVGSKGFLMEFKNDFYYPADKASRQLLRNASSLNQYEMDVHSFKKAFDLLTSVFVEFGEKKTGYQEVIKANLSIFFIELMRHHKEKTSTSSLPINQYTQEQLDKLVELIETHISSHKEVSQYADMMHLSVYQLNAITKATLGKTCSELINEHIILEAKRYLLATSNQVNQIAFHLGYEDVSYFIRFFKKHTGFTPETFRHNFK